MARKVAWPSSNWDPWLLGIWAVAWELAGRLLFPNWDVSYAIYGARFWMDRGSAWMNVWPGMDFLLGQLANMFGESEAAVSLVGIILNLGATLIVWAIGKSLGLDRIIAISAALATGLWFKPPLGGWVGDHLSFGVALMPALLLALQRGNWNRWLGLISGACLAYGLTLKLNNSVPGLLISGIWIIAFLLNKNKFQKPEARNLASELGWIIIGAGVTAVLFSVLIPITGGLYPKIIDTYSLVINSKAASQAEWQKLLMLPLQINIQEAINEQQKGVLIFIPIVVAFWLAMLSNACRIYKKPFNCECEYISILLLASSAFVGLSLGRGLTHRLFLLPAGLIFSIGHQPWPIRWRRLGAMATLGYLLTCWLSFAWIQRNAERQGGYNPRLILADSNQKNLCIDLSKTPTISKTQCWSSSEVAEQFAGLVDVQMIANELGISFRNQAIGEGDLREKWNWRQATKEGRKAWIKEQVKIINNLKLPYLIERLSLTEAELENPQYAEFKEARLKQRAQLAKELGATELGRIGGATLWRTRWGTKSP